LNSIRSAFISSCADLVITAMGATSPDLSLLSVAIDNGDLDTGRDWAAFTLFRPHWLLLKRL
jgi:hypothetical protein